MNNFSNSLKMAYRKLKLQRLQLKHLKSDKKSARYLEQREVFKLLFSTGSLFTLNRMDSKENKLYKYLNVLNSNVKDDFFYTSLVEAMRHEQ